MSSWDARPPAVGPAGRDTQRERLKPRWLSGNHRQAGPSRRRSLRVVVGSPPVGARSASSRAASQRSMTTCPSSTPRFRPGAGAGGEALSSWGKGDESAWLGRTAASPGAGLTKRSSSPATSSSVTRTLVSRGPCGPNRLASSASSASRDSMEERAERAVSASAWGGTWAMASLIASGVILPSATRAARSLAFRRPACCVARASCQRARVSRSGPAVSTRGNLSQGDRERRVEEPPGSVPQLEVAPFGAGVAGVPVSVKEPREELQAIGQAGEAASSRQGLGEPGGDRGILRLVAQAAAAACSITRSQRANDFCQGPGSAVVFRPSCLAEFVIRAVGLEVAPRGVGVRERFEQGLHVQPANGRCVGAHRSFPPSGPRTRRGLPRSALRVRMCLPGPGVSG